ncbi:unnamed protein product [Rhizoctonia solani]|uniref:Uncharacterized protein n=1 Tax=Rhizoctonia solani TaxID=456999 RepID=A0A8H3ACH4_9AGAM|nr:unnamed protein product [Rhizoctonia solani]
MSQMPVAALNARVPPSRRPSGHESVWQADVSQAYQQHSADPRTPYDPNASKPWVKNPEMLESLVPASEREGTNSDGIPKKLAWLAKNGYTVHTYEEILSSRNPGPQISRKERRRLLMERKKAIYENAKSLHEAAKAKQPSRRQPPTGPAMSTAPRGAYSHQSSSAPERYSCEAPMTMCDDTAPVEQVDISSWINGYFKDVDPAFLPSAGLPLEVALFIEVNNLFSYEEQVAEGLIPEGCDLSQHEQYYQPQQQDFENVAPQFPNFPSTGSYTYRR